MKSRVRAIIIQDGQLLTIKRTKIGQIYWKFPGGGVEDGENHERALKRECQEELGVQVEILDLMFEHLLVHEMFAEQMEYFYRCVIVGGKLGTGDGPEYASNSCYQGTHEPQWLNLNDLPNLDVRPSKVRNSLLGRYWQ